MKALVFHYKWPLIKEKLSYTEYIGGEVPHSWRLSELYGPVGAWLYVYDEWFHKARNGGISPWSSRHVTEVPKDIRATALILNTN